MRVTAHAEGGAPLLEPSRPANAGLPSPQGLRPSAANGLTPKMAAPTALTLSLTRRKRLEMLNYVSDYAALCPKGLRPSGLPLFRSQTRPPPRPIGRSVPAATPQGFLLQGGGRLSWLALNAPQVSMKRDGDHHSTAALPLGVPSARLAKPGRDQDRAVTAESGSN